jgi:tyrosyl-tRNA synthetase
MKNDVGASENSPNQIFGLTAPLLMTVDGKKMGKTEKGTLWVARDKTTPFDFYQYFYNMPDENTGLLLSLFTDIPMPEIVAMCTTDIVAAKKRMAYEITKLIHGEELAVEAVAAAMALFNGGANAAAVPTKKMAMPEPVNLVDFLVQSDIVPSKSEARRAIEQGGIQLDGVKITDKDFIVQPAESILIQKGKKNFLKVVAG